MNRIQVYTSENMNGLKRFEASNLSYSTIKNIDFAEIIPPISFMRSDFRGVKVNNVSFYKNNLDRSDFIDAVMEDVSFEKVNFGCCQIKNCYFKNAVFKNNYYRNASIHSTTFINCNFPDESFLINMQRCRFIDCSFNGCSFDMSTTDSDVFENCTFTNTNLATMHAENHTFVKCKFSKVLFDADYLLGYLTANCRFEDCQALYRGEYVSLDDLEIIASDKYLLEHRRYLELINWYHRKTEDAKIVKIIEESIPYYINHPYGRMLNLTGIFNALIFYTGHEEIKFDVMYDALTVIGGMSWDELSFSEQVELDALLLKYKETLFASNHSWNYVSKIDPSMNSTLTIRFDDDNYDKCISNAEVFMMQFVGDNNWELIDSHSGSWILTFLIPTMVLVYALPSIAKRYNDVFYDIKTKRKLGNLLLEKLDKPKLSTERIEEIEKIVVDAQLILPNGDNDKDIIKEITSITANI